MVVEGSYDKSPSGKKDTQSIIWGIQLLPIQAPGHIHPWWIHHTTQDHSPSKLLDGGLRDLIWRKNKAVINWCPQEISNIADLEAQPPDSFPKLST
jgi:hypothetical protein